jgi:hypothetical protein
MTTRHRDLTTPALYSQTRPSRGTAQASQSAALAELANDAAGGHPAQRATVLRNEGGTFHCFIWPDTTAIYYAVRITVVWKVTPTLRNEATVTLQVTDGTTVVGPGASPYLPRDLQFDHYPGVSGARLSDFRTREVYVQRDSLVAAGLSPSVPWRFTFVVTTSGTYVEAIEIAEVSRFATDTADTYGADPDYYLPRSIIDDNVVSIGATLEAAYDLQRRTYHAVSLDDGAHDDVTSGTYAPIPGSQLESVGVASRWEVRPRLMGGVPEVQFGVRYRTTGAHTGGVQITTGAGTYTLALPTTSGAWVDDFTGVGYLAQAATDEIHWDAFSSAGTLHITSYWIVETP